MIDQDRRKRMREYLTDRLSGQYAVERKMLHIDKTNFHYIQLSSKEDVSSTQAILLIDRKLSSNDIEKAYTMLAGNIENPVRNVGMVVFKDGGADGMFFRSAAQHYAIINKREADAQRRTPYHTDIVNKIMQLTPEEIFVNHIYDGRIQYYQPKSEKPSGKLEECIRQYTVRSINADQGGRVIQLGFSKPLVGLHPQDHVLILEQEYDCPLQLFGKYLAPA